MFEELFARALREWPAELRLPIREEPGLHIVEGLRELESKISKPWVGHPDEVLMVNLHWAMAAAYHAAFKKQPSVRHEDLDVSRVQEKFEADLKRIREGKIPTWTEDDRAIIARYFAGASAR
jgi:hypothetical protein